VHFWNSFKVEGVHWYVETWKECRKCARCL